MLEILQRCSRLDFLVTPSLGNAKKVFHIGLGRSKINDAIRDARQFKRESRHQAGLLVQANERS
jgi:hypothetical protein